MRNPREPITGHPFDVLIIDIDGVMCAGKICGKDGRTIAKQFCDIDWTAIKRFQACGIQVCFLSGDKWNEGMAAKRKIPFFHNEPGIDKATFIPMIKAKYETEYLAYVGDDYYDIATMNAVGPSFCPSNSPAIVKRAAVRTLPVPAGQGCIAAIFDIYEKLLPDIYPKDSPDVNP